VEHQGQEISYTTGRSKSGKEIQAVSYSSQTALPFLLANILLGFSGSSGRKQLWAQPMFVYNHLLQRDDSVS
jgi:hypothetical protein